MNISVLSGRKFPAEEALRWINDCQFLDKGNHFRVVLDGPGDEILRFLLRRGEKTTLHLPASLVYVPAKNLPLVRLLEERGKVVFGENKYPRGEEFRERNYEMISKSSLLIAFWDGKEPALEWTIKVAQKKQKKLIIVRREKNGR